MDVMLLGTASAPAGSGRDNTYLLIGDEQGATLVDVGGNPLGKLKAVRVPLAHVRRVVLTHAHVDHVYGLPSLLWGMWMEDRTEPLDLYCPDAVHPWLEAWLRATGIWEWPVAFEIRFHPFDWRQRQRLWQEGDSRLEAFPGRHGVPAAGVAYVRQGQVVVYSSDTAPNEEIKAYERIDLLVHEATTARERRENHSGLEQIVRFYDWTRIRRAVMVHLTDDEPYGEVWRSLPEHLRAKISFGQELMTISIT